MKKLVIAILLLLTVLLCACNKLPPNGQTLPTTQPQETTVTPPETTVATTEAPTTEPTTVPTTMPTEALHSDLYLPDVSLQEVITYFEEVVLDMEYSDGVGDVTLVQKWTMPIYYWIYGDPTDQDLAVLEDLFAQLNAIDGFPGIYEAGAAGWENMSLSFLDANAFRNSFSDVVGGEDAYGATQFWYFTASNELHTARIGYRTDIDQQARNSILIEEVINSLGITDTILRTDSVVYQYSDENTALSDVDLLILQLLYEPGMQCGMDREDCEVIIADLYY